MKVVWRMRDTSIYDVHPVGSLEEALEVRDAIRALSTPSSLSVPPVLMLHVCMYPGCSSPETPYFVEDKDVTRKIGNKACHSHSIMPHAKYLEDLAAYLKATEVFRRVVKDYISAKRNRPAGQKESSFVVDGVPSSPNETTKQEPYRKMEKMMSDEWEFTSEPRTMTVPLYTVAPKLAVTEQAFDHLMRLGIPVPRREAVPDEAKPGIVGGGGGISVSSSCGDYRPCSICSGRNGSHDSACERAYMQEAATVVPQEVIGGQPTGPRIIEVGTSGTVGAFGGSGVTQQSMTPEIKWRAELKPVTPSSDGTVVEDGILRCSECEGRYGLHYQCCPERAPPRDEIVYDLLRDDDGRLVRYPQQRIMGLAAEAEARIAALPTRSKPEVSILCDLDYED